MLVIRKGRAGTASLKHTKKCAGLDPNVHSGGNRAELPGPVWIQILQGTAMVWVRAHAPHYVPFWTGWNRKWYQCMDCHVAFDVTRSADLDHCGLPWKFTRKRTKWKVLYSQQNSNEIDRNVRFHYETMKSHCIQCNKEQEMAEKMHASTINRYASKWEPPDGENRLAVTQAAVLRDRKPPWDAGCPQRHCGDRP